MKKKKIWSSIGKIACALLVVSSWVWFGVALALSNTTVKLGGGISFIANDVNATINVSITGSASDPNDTDLKFTPDTQATDAKGQSAIPSITDLDLTFQDSKTPITVTLTVTNKHTEYRNLKVRVSASEIGANNQAITSGGRLTFENSVGDTSVDNFTTTVIKGSSPSTKASAQSASLNEEEGVSTQSLTDPYPFITNNFSQTFTIKMYYKTLNNRGEEITNKNLSTDNNFKIEIKLMDQDYVENASDYPGLEFNYFTQTDTQNNTSYFASVGQKDTAKNIYIPSQIKYNNIVYTVATIGTDYYSNSPEAWLQFNGEITSIFIPKTITTIYGNFVNGQCFSSLSYAYFEDCSNDQISWSYCYDDDNGISHESDITISNSTQSNLSTAAETLVSCNTGTTHAYFKKTKTQSTE